MRYKIAMGSLGCPKNQVDAEIMLSKLQDAGYELTSDEAEADIIIINTCGFIEDAKQESIDTILEIAELKKTAKLKKLIVTGCLAQRYPDELAAQIPEIDAIVQLGKNGDIVDVITETLKDGGIFRGDKEDLPLCGGRVLVNEPFYAYLKIAEGCNNCCTYCAIPHIRGKMRSRTIEDIVSEAETLAGYGVKELVLVAQDTTRYGEDIYSKSALPDLLLKLCDIESIHWIRLLYAYPERITDELLDVMSSQSKICKYIDIPIQHCCRDILKKMNRPGDRKALTETIQKIRSKMPGAIIRTTVITGFPSETEDQFSELCEFVKEMRFERLGAFAYSEEEGTAAAKMEQIPEETRRHRQEILTEQQAIIGDEITESYHGKIFEVLVEGYDSHIKHFYGRSYMDAPDVDCKVFFKSDVKLESGDFVQVYIEDSLEMDLIGKKV